MCLGWNASPHAVPKDHGRATVWMFTCWWRIWLEELPNGTLKPSNKLNQANHLVFKKHLQHFALWLDGERSTSEVSQTCFWCHICTVAVGWACSTWDPWLSSLIHFPTFWVAKESSYGKENGKGSFSFKWEAQKFPLDWGIMRTWGV